VAGFNYSVTGYDVTFTDTSTDDGTITAWNWSFGDGGTSTGQNPVHTYTAGGTYTVTLTVTDIGGLTGSASNTVTVISSDPVNLVLTAAANVLNKTKSKVLLSWTPSGTVVDVYRDGAK